MDKTPSWIIDYYRERGRHTEKNGCAICGWRSDRGIHLGRVNHSGNEIPFHDFVPDQNNYKKN